LRQINKRVNKILQDYSLDTKVGIGYPSNMAFGFTWRKAWQLAIGMVGALVIFVVILKILGVQD
jgi:uncharacterized membrane protein (Fun14 family)